jgi:serine phosphatase RsbU (regulator of sigma subunit)
LRPRIINLLLLLAALVLWGFLLRFHFVQKATWVLGEGSFSAYPALQYRIVLTLFMGVSSLLAARVYGHIERMHATALLWRIFITGMAGVTLILLVTFANQFLVASALRRYLAAMFFCLGLAALLIFFLSALFIYRRLILYPRTRRKLITWWVFMAFLGLGLLLPFLPRPDWSIFLYIPFFGVVLMLASQVRWVSYLNFSQKLRALGMLVLILLVIITYMIAASNLPAQLEIEPAPAFSLGFLPYLVFFSLTYTGVSILVVFFNLPTSSVFERDSLDIVSFDKINRVIQSNLDYSHILEALLDASIMTANAQSGWIEMVDDPERPPVVKVYQRLQLAEIAELTQGQELTRKVLEEKRYSLFRNLRLARPFRHLRLRFRSMLCVPIHTGSASYGVMYLVSDLVNPFEEVMIKSVISMAEQSGIALENARLIQSSIQVERYQEQLKIAQQVQQQLLPARFPEDARLSLAARTQNAEEVGGDYFDVVRAPGGPFRFAVGDVSGKGTTAAFYMAEVKGVFHALASLDLDVLTFVKKSNHALYECIQRGAFVTFVYAELDPASATLELMRAGHCPPFLYRAASGEVEEIREGTPGLGIFRPSDFDRRALSTVRRDLAPGDVLVLYTDGIPEAKNPAGDMYGYARMAEVIREQACHSADALADALIRSVQDFAQSALGDDYTVLVLRFGPNLPTLPT